MFFKFANPAENHWHRLNGQNRLLKVILEVRFTDGIDVANEQAETAA
jgi:hypothetical protein